MDGITNVILGMTAPETNAEGETVVIKNGKYDTALGLVVLEFEMGDSSISTKKNAGEILELAKGGAILYGRMPIDEDDIVTAPVVECSLSSGTYSLSFITQAGSVATLTGSSADSPLTMALN